MLEDDLVGPDLIEHLTEQATRLTRNPADAKDLVQDTIERGLRNRHRFSYGSLGLWLTRVMHNLFIDRCRRKRLDPLSKDTPDPAIAGDADFGQDVPIWTQVSDEMLQQAIDALDPPSREVFLRHEVDHWPYARIAAALGIAVPTVGTRLHRARRKIRLTLMQSFNRAAGGQS